MKKSDPLPELRVLLANYSLSIARNKSSNLPNINDHLKKYSSTQICECILNDSLEGYFQNNSLNIPFLTTSSVNQLRKSWKKNIKNDLIVRYQLPLVLNSLAKENIHPVINRGITWNRYYKNVVIRSACDIDVFLESGQLKKCEKVLNENDWNRHQVYSHLWFKNGVELDLHDCIFGIEGKSYFQKALNFPYLEVIANSRFHYLDDLFSIPHNDSSSISKFYIKTSHELTSIRLFDIVDDFIYNTIHWVSHSYELMRRGVDLALVSDEITYLNKWDDVIRRSGEYRLERIFNCSVIPLNSIFNLNLPVLEIPGNGGLTKLENKLIGSISAGYRIPFCGKYLLANESRSFFKKMQFYMKGVLPNRVDMHADAVRFPTIPLFFVPIFRLMRVFRAGWRLMIYRFK